MSHAARTCISIGISNILFGLILAALSIRSFIVDQVNQLSSATRIMLLFISFAGILFSTLLLIGYFKTRPSLLLVYLSFGVLQAIMSLIFIILELIHVHWKLALSQTTITLIYFYGLAQLNEAYESMVNDYSRLISVLKEVDDNASENEVNDSLTP